jgi:hypothetical protein
LAVLQRRVHFEIQAIFLLLTKRVDLSIYLFSIIFLPGVFLHEVSHFLAARLLRVPTGRFSIFPRPLPGGKLQLGYVETYKTDIFRDALIGVAPLIAGMTVIATIAFYQFGLLPVINPLDNPDVNISWALIANIFNQSDFWIWFYIIFVISSTMYPSASDRRSWLPIILLVVGIIIVSVLFGAGPWMIQVAPGLNGFLLEVATILGICALIHVVLFLPLWAVRLLIVRTTGMRVA